ncbi:hypothetical protein BGX29_012187 [Mortierella sp. GBA35]|nr:hypothetical protein BGX29_012187 [Mortierella sp. GBA35]
MFKSAVPSVAPSASASASSHDTHSLPPAFKGPVQRFLAVSLPTITLTPEFIDILDAVDVSIPSRLQVTIRWWNEDSASSLSVYPKLNSPLSPSIEAHQSFLRQQRLDKEKALQLQQQQQQGLQQQKQEQEQEQERQQNPLSTTAGNSAQPSLPTQTQQRSMAAKFLRRPLTGGARLMNVFRIGTNKRAKDSKASNVKTPLSSTALENDTAALRGNDLPDTDKRRQDDHPDRVGIPTPTPNPTTAPTPAPPRPPAEAKPLPTLPDAAYPVTVAYPVRCSLDQLYRYFLEMTSLTLEIQIAPNLIVLASVPNLADLFRNIHGTFSGVFPFTTVLLNDNPQLATQKIFSRRSVLGMVVFQAWSQDTSDIGDTSEESESGSFGSVHPDNDDNNNNNTDEQPAAYHRQHYPHGSIHHHRQHSHHQPVDHPAGYYRHPPQPQPPPLQTPTYPQQPPYRLRPSLGIPSKQSQPIYPLNPNTIMDPATLLQQQRQRAAATSPHGQHHRGGSSYNQQPSSGSRHRDTHGHQPSLRFDDESMAYRPRRFPSYPHPHAIGPSAMPYEDRYREGRGGGGGRQQVTTGAAGVGSFGPSRQFPIAKLPASDLGPPHDGTYRRFARSSVQRPSQDESAFRYRRSEGTNTTTHHSQNSRSRPRSGATAAAIGRLDSVLARGEDLLQGMKTSLALDPEEVRMRSARHLRSSALRDDQVSIQSGVEYPDGLFDISWAFEGLQAEKAPLTSAGAHQTSTVAKAPAAAAATAASHGVDDNGVGSSSSL